LKCFSHRPDFLRDVIKFSDTVHFSHGHLDRRTKEAIASWVSWLNRLPVLTGFACILPACSGSRRKYGASDSKRQTGRSRLEPRRACVA
jgi:hypothetical protein